MENNVFAERVECEFDSPITDDQVHSAALRRNQNTNHENTKVRKHEKRQIG
jgi:hypothetical protein